MEEHPQARYIVETLTKAGYVAYYAGGWVRDYILKHPSDDIDIATSAPPEVIQSLFPRTVPIGLAFGIILVLIDGKEYEVATFRQDLDYLDGRRPSKVSFSSPQEDAKRRDFTINGMFYNPLTKEILDYVGGKEDLERKLIRAIGNPHQRIQEDRLRMIRAIRLAGRFSFAIDPATEQAIRDHANELFPAVAIERIVQELEKAKAFGKLHSMLHHLHHFGLLASIFPSLQSISMQEMDQRLAPIHFFPLEAPLIAYLLQLFPNSSQEERLSLVKTLKLSNESQSFAELLHRAQTLLHKSADLWEWAHFYAQASSSTAIEVIAANLDPNQKDTLLLSHSAKLKQLSAAIERIQTRNPLVKSSDLIAMGISPGKQMGMLLESAEKISINQQIDDKRVVIEELKKRLSQL